MQKILLTGANGFVGWYLTKKLLEGGYVVAATSRSGSRQPVQHQTGQFIQLDYTDAAAVTKTIDDCRPDVIIHSGAISNPDECERDKTAAHNNNVQGTKNLLQAAEKHRCQFIFLSTDFVFPGTHGMSSEEDAPQPVNSYAQTKLEAEEAVRHYAFAWTIVRTVLVYGPSIPGRETLVTVVAEKLKQRQTVTLFEDQVRNPTYVGDLVDGILRIIERGATGIYHLAGEDRMSLYEAGLLIADAVKADRELVKPIKDGDIPLLAARPKDGGLHTEKAKRELGYAPVSFAEGLLRTISL